jgi:CspA family cold shock protein
MSNRITGTVKFFSKDKGYGFIQRDDGDKDVFVHYSNIQGSGFRNLEQDQRVEFGTEMGDKGIRAIDVTMLDS